jgi:hypothetical protein
MLIRTKNPVTGKTKCWNESWPGLTAAVKDRQCAMFRHITGPTLTTEELKAADGMMANGWEPGWLTREHIADEIRGQKERLKLARKLQKQR